MKPRHNYTFPRTMEQAFGPYQRYGLVEQPDPMPTKDKIVVGVGIVALAILFVLIALLGDAPW